MKLDEFRAASCNGGGCWDREGFRDGGVDVELGPGWHAFRIEWHFASRFGCVRRRVGGYCDAIGVHEQDSNSTVRVIEAKAGGKVDSTAARQLQRGADFVDALIGRRPVHVTAELHTGPGPAITARSRAQVSLATSRRRIPIEVIRSV